MRKVLLFCLLLCSSGLYVAAQSSNVPLGGDTYDIIDRWDIKYNKLLPFDLHTGIKPYSRRRVADLNDSLLHEKIAMNKRDTYNAKYLIQDNSEWYNDTVIKSKKAVWKVFYREPATLAQVDIKGFSLKINPAFYFQVGKEIENKQVEFINTRAIDIRGTIAKRLSFYTQLYENQYRGMTYVQNRIIQDNAVSGQGYYKSYHTTGVDFFDARGGIVYNAFDHIDIQLAHDKNFIGNGYRSFFLSDYSDNYFFLKLHTTVWRLSYTNIFAEMISTYNRGLDQNLPRKYVAIHHLNIKATKFLDIGLFESVVYARENHFEAQYLNPIIFYKAIQNSLGSPDKSDVGLDYKINFAKHFQIYQQILFDEFNFKNLIKHNGWWANKYAIQAGIKYVDAFFIKNLDLQAEFNIARPYTFTHGDSATTYTHYNQPLGNPLGANFWEMIYIVKYQVLPELKLTTKFMYYEKGLDSAGINFGGDIFTPYVQPGTQNLNVYQEYGNTIGQGDKNKVFLMDLLLSYQLRHNFYFDLNIIVRHSSAMQDQFNNMGVFGGLGIRYNIAYRGHMY